MDQARRDSIQSVYDAVGRDGSQAPQGLEMATGRPLAEALGYPSELLDRVPATVLDAFVGAAPLAVLAAPAAGQVVLDLGCGAGLDSLLAADRGARVLAVDASATMLSRLGHAAGYLPAQAVHAAAPDLPVAQGCCDWAWLNGVANLIPDRPRLLRELLRVLRPGGRLLLADVFALEEVPEEIRALPEAWAWCVGGAAHPDQWRRQLQHAGFHHVRSEVLEEFLPLGRGLASAERP